MSATRKRIRSCTKGAGTGSDLERAADGDTPGAGKFSGAQPDYRGDAAGGGGCGGEAVRRIVDHGSAGDGVWAGVFGVPGNATQEMSFAPNQLIKQATKLVTSAEDVIEELPTSIRAVLVQAEEVESQQRNLLAGDGLSGSQKTIYEMLTLEEPRPIDDIVLTSGLNSSEVLATLFDLEMKGMVRQIPGKQFSKVPL
jgi:hypothetical protein